jgi:hypothetical protein
MIFPARICERGTIVNVNYEAYATETHLRMLISEGRSRCSRVGLAIRLWAGQPWVLILVGARDLLFSKNGQSRSGTHPASNSVGCYPGVKWPGHEVKYSLPFSAKVENEWSFTSAPPICLHGIDRKNFTFLTFMGEGIATVRRYHYRQF